MINALKSADVFTVTLNTTEDCCLRCKYCYEINKQPRELSIDKAKKFIDFVLTEEDPCDVKDDPSIVFRNIYNKGLCIDFIGGDSFMNVDFLDEICTYIIYKMFTTDPSVGHVANWRNNFRFSLSTNGCLFEQQKVRDFCLKYKSLLQPGVSIDGCPEIHDMNRIFPDGRGSMSTILKSWDWFKSVFPSEAKSTKSTLSKNSIPYLYESLKFMHETIGLSYINQNFIMEDAHLEQSDLDLFDEQMEKCVDYTLQHRHDLYWSMIDYNRFATAHLSTGTDWFESGHCGSGCMPALSIDGFIYPCFRWLPHTQAENSTKFVVGDVERGFYNSQIFKKVREGAYRCNCTKKEECKTCEYESACSYCIGGCYAENNDFIRTTHICEITKRQVRWARVYWDKYNEIEGLPPIDWDKECHKLEKDE